MTGIRSVAKRAGVSTATVSRVLNQDKTLKVTDETKKKIEEAVRFYDYKKKVRSKKVLHQVSIITTVSEMKELDDPYFRSIRIGIQTQAKNSGIQLGEIIRLTETPLNTSDLSDSEAVLMIGQVLPEVIQEIAQKNPNIIVIDDPNVDPNLKVDAVYTDLRQSTFQQLDRLYAKGHRNIVFIGGQRIVLDIAGKEHVFDDDSRCEAYIEWMKKNQLEDYIKTYLGEWSTLSALELTDLFLAEHEGQLPTAIIAASDPIAVGVYRGLQRKNIQIPEDISVVSFDNIEVAEFLTPPLSSVNVETEEIGKFAVLLAKERIESKRTIPIKVLVDNQIIERDSEKDLT